MSDKNKNKKKSLKDFLRYRRNVMTGEERNSFERKLQKDPFAEEAAEGLFQISAEEIKEDLLILQKRLGKKPKPMSRIIFYRMAAAIAVLLVVSAIFIVTLRKDDVINLSENIHYKEMTPVSIPVPEVLQKPVDKPSAKKQAIPTEIPQKPEADDQSAEIRVADLQLAEPNQIIMKDSEITEPDLSLVTAEEVGVKSFAIGEKMDMVRAAEAPVNANRKEIRDYIPPQVTVGKDSFDLYLEKNIHNPGPENYVQQVVIVSFKVRVDSTTTGFKILSSPGQSYSKEAIRLIKDGPAWKPAEENGIKTEDEVRVRIVFR